MATVHLCVHIRYLEKIERAVSNGDCLLLENIGESVDPVLDPLLGRLTIKKGRYIKIGDKEVEFHPRFRCVHGEYFPFSLRNRSILKKLLEPLYMCALWAGPCVLYLI